MAGGKGVGTCERLLVLLSFVLGVVVGVPVWWEMTTVPRAAGLDEALREMRAAKSHLFGLGDAEERAAARHTLEHLGERPSVVPRDADPALSASVRADWAVSVGLQVVHVVQDVSSGSAAAGAPQPDQLRAELSAALADAMKTGAAGGRGSSSDSGDGGDTAASRVATPFSLRVDSVQVVTEPQLAAADAALARPVGASLDTWLLERGLLQSLDSGSVGVVLAPSSWLRVPDDGAVTFGSGRVLWSASSSGWAQSVAEAAVRRLLLTERALETPSPATSAARPIALPPAAQYKVAVAVQPVLIGASDHAERQEEEQEEETTKEGDLNGGDETNATTAATASANVAATITRGSVARAVRGLPGVVGSVVDRAVMPFVDAVSPAVAQVSVESFVLPPRRLGRTLRVRRDKNGEQVLYIPPRELAEYLSPNELNLDSAESSALPVVHLLLAVPVDMPPGATLGVCEDAGLSDATTMPNCWEDPAFTVPQWGGVAYTQGATADAVTAAMPALVAQLRELMGLPPFNPQDSEPAAHGVAQWEVDALVRRAGFAHMASAASSLEALAVVLEKLTEMPVPDATLGVCQRALDELRRAESAVWQGGDFAAANAHAARAVQAAERAFFDENMLGLLYFPDEHKYAVYALPFAPVALQLLGALRGEFDAWRKRRTAAVATR